MKRFMVGFLVVTALSGGAVVGANSAQRSPATDREDAATMRPALPEGSARIMARIQRSLMREQRSPVRCFTVQCINRTLSRLDTQLDRVTRDFNALYNAFWNCEQVMPITQYGGYMAEFADGSTGTTTALDVTFETDPVDVWALHWTCGVTEG